ncbi:MAG TPA: ABC transporter permease, partial [Roseiflexaceae bacterium]|nr:ABC transporter permease [Roseiflexaceae bacterium]
MINLLRAEWLKMSRRPLTWILLAIFLALFVVQAVSQTALAALLGERPGDTILAVQIAEWRRRVMLPGLFGAVLNHLNSLGAAFVVIFAAGMMGSEYSWGTLRAQLARHPDRTRFLLAKIMAIMLAISAAALFNLVLGLLIGLPLAAAIGSIGEFSFADLLQIPLALLRAVYVLLPYLLLTISWTLLGRSVLAGVAGGLGYLILEAGVGTLALPQILGGAGTRLSNLSNGPKIKM